MFVSRGMRLLTDKRHRYDAYVAVIEPLPIDLPDVESLRCFVAALRSPTFRAAAREVALTPAAPPQSGVWLLAMGLGLALAGWLRRAVSFQPRAFGR